MKMFGKVILVACLALGAIPNAASAASWKAISLYGGVVGYGEGNYEDEARSNALFQCRIEAGKDANCSNGTAVEVHWNLAGVRCWQGNRSWNFSAGSQYGTFRALGYAFEKAVSAGFSEESCEPVAFD